MPNIWLVKGFRLVKGMVANVPKKSDTRERLLEAAIAVLETDGEVAIRVGDLATSANVTKPSVYHFFGDREGLIIAALAEMYRRSLAWGREDLLEIARSAESREQFSDFYFSIVRSFSSEEGVRRRALRIEVLGASVSRPRLQSAIVEMHQDQVNFMVELFTVGKERGLLTIPFDLQTTALWASAVILGRHFAEIDPAADSVEWDVLTQTAFKYIMFGTTDLS